MDNKPFFIDEKEMAALKSTVQNEEPKEEVKEEVAETKTVEETPVLEEKNEEIVSEEVVEEPAEEKTEEPKKEEKQEITKTEPVKDIEKTETKKAAKPIFQMDIKMFTTIFLAIIVTYCFLTVARSLFMGFKYYDYAHGDKTAEVQK